MIGAVNYLVVSQVAASLPCRACFQPFEYNSIGIQDGQDGEYAQYYIANFPQSMLLAPKKHRSPLYEDVGTKKKYYGGRHNYGKCTQNEMAR